MSYRLSRRSRRRLEGVHPDLAAIVADAIKITEIDFTVLKGLRSLDTQREYLRRGVSKTMNSRHLTGHAVDLGAWIGRTVRWEMAPYREIARAMKAAAAARVVPLEWGFDLWGWDGPHFQLPWDSYPKEAS